MSVAVYSTADAESAVVKFADEAVQIGPPAVGRSYLHIPSLIGAALKTGADAIHPGYGFLSEDPYFAEICTDEGITFIGPRPDVTEKGGDKATARELIEEAPSIHLTEETRREVGEAAVRGALSVGYTGAGTMEFLLDLEGNLFFMEMNARIQVEHPVSELVTSTDLIQEQIRVAAGEKLSVGQDDVLPLHGHAIECRINAEDPDNNFAPAAGKLDTYVAPGGPWPRVDSHCYPGWTISPFYDSLIAKLIVWAPDRDKAIDRMIRALQEFAISRHAVQTTIPFHLRILDHPQFRSGDVTTA